MDFYNDYNFIYVSGVGVFWLIIGRIWALGVIVGGVGFFMSGLAGVSDFDVSVKFFFKV